MDTSNLLLIAAAGVCLVIGGTLLSMDSRIELNDNVALVDNAMVVSSCQDENCLELKFDTPVIRKRIAELKRQYGFGFASEMRRRRQIIQEGGVRDW